MSTSLVRMTATRRLRLGDNWYVEQGEPFRFPAGAAATLTDSGGAFAIDRPDSKPAMLLTLRWRCALPSGRKGRAREAVHPEPAAAHRRQADRAGRDGVAARDRRDRMTARGRAARDAAAGAAAGRPRAGARSQARLIRRPLGRDRVATNRLWIRRSELSKIFTKWGRRQTQQAEMLLGARLLPRSKRRQQLETALDAMFREDFAGRVLPFDSAAAGAYAAVVAARRGAGRPISQFEAQIAAIALSRRAALATRNVSDFEACGLTLTNPWSARCLREARQCENRLSTARLRHTQPHFDTDIGKTTQHHQPSGR